MKFRKSPIALAAFTLCGALPLAAQAAPSVSIITPASGATLSGIVSGSACAINASSDVVMAQFWANNAQINNDYSAPYTCNFDTRTLPDGNYTYRAVVLNARGQRAEQDIPITIRNRTPSPSPSPSPTPTPTPSGSTPAPQPGSLDVWFKAPANGATVSGALNAGSNCYVNASGNVA